MMSLSKGDGIFEFLRFVFRLITDIIVRPTIGPIAEWEPSQWFWLLLVLSIAAIFYIWRKR